LHALQSIVVERHSVLLLEARLQFDPPQTVKVQVSLRRDSELAGFYPANNFPP
jgi:hypothetical protein